MSDSNSGGGCLYIGNQVIDIDASQIIKDPNCIKKGDMVMISDIQSHELQWFIVCNTDTGEYSDKKRIEYFSEFQKLGFGLGVDIWDNRIWAKNFDTLIPLDLAFDLAIRPDKTETKGLYRLNNNEIREYDGTGWYRSVHFDKWRPDDGHTMEMSSRVSLNQIHSDRITDEGKNNG